MEYLGLDVPIVTNVNYIGSALSSPGSLLFTDHAAVWAVDKTGYRGDKKYKYRIIGLPPVSYVFCLFYRQVAFHFKSLYYVPRASQSIDITFSTPPNLPSCININLLSCCSSHFLLLNKTALHTFF